jgi:orotidine-5'-phosphate decarboxylase
VQQEKGDQTRVASLETAVKENTDYIVLGREISQAENIGKMINKLESYII